MIFVCRAGTSIDEPSDAVIPTTYIFGHDYWTMGTFKFYTRTPVFVASVVCLCF